jgi:predicted nucleic acid-binding protein
MIYVLDTNVLSELMRTEPHPAVFAWIAARPRASLFTTSLSRGEVLAGIAILPEGRRRAALAETAETMFGEEFRGRILSFHAEAASVYAEIFARRRHMGRPIATPDLIVAATARAHDATVVTRDAGGFEGCGLTLVNPWEEA